LLLNTFYFLPCKVISGYLLDEGMSGVAQCLDPRERGPGPMDLPKSVPRQGFDTAANLFPTLFSRIAFEITGCFRRLGGP
jgi:hypothetical protein